MADDREERIKARAHEIWEGRGRPDGSHDEHWFEAAQQIDAEIGDDAPPVHPTMSGGAAETDTLPDPFSKRESDASGIDAVTPRPKSAGRSKAPKSL